MLYVFVMLVLDTESVTARSNNLDNDLSVPFQGKWSQYINIMPECIAPVSVLYSTTKY